ncbi:MAG: GGDEF domain-containing protein [Planctomycetota bacterium]|nr:GGDEF domain-containing protein [Planctomycetota bacterium]
MFGFDNPGIAVWALVGAAVLGPSLAVMLAIRDRHRLVSRLGNLEDVLRRMRATDPASKFDDRPEESSLQLSRERLVLTNLLDRFPEVTQKFVTVETIDALGSVLLSAFERVLDCDYGVAFVRDDEDRLRFTAQTGLPDKECYPGMTLQMGKGRVGYAAAKCLILRPDDFDTLDDHDHRAVENNRAFERDFDLYVPMVHRGRALGCVAVGGMKKVVQKAHSVSMALANLGALVITNIQRAAEIRALSETDPLTKLSNRRHCYAQLDARLRHRNQAPFAVFLYDIDFFKRINDAHGHAIGDAVLVKVAELTRNVVRPEEGEFACRFGGEEFLCVVNCEDLPSLTARLEAVRESFARVRLDPGDGSDPIQVKISGGVAFCPAECDDADSLIRLADDRLYVAKETGRDRICFESSSREVAS